MTHDTWENVTVLQVLTETILLLFTQQAFTSTMQVLILHVQVSIAPKTNTEIPKKSYEHAIGFCTEA